MNDPLRVGTWMCVLFFLIGLALLVAAIGSIWRTQTFIAQSVPVPGRVINIEYSQDLEGFVTVFTFTDSTGQQHTNRTSGAQNPPSHQVGDAVIVLYPPNRPADARIRSFQTLWVIPAFLSSFGIMFTASGLIAYSQLRKTYGPKN